MPLRKQMNKKQRRDQNVLIPVAGRPFIVSDWQERNLVSVANKYKHNKVKKDKVLRGMR